MHDESAVPHPASLDPAARSASDPAHAHVHAIAYSSKTPRQSPSIRIQLALSPGINELRKRPNSPIPSLALPAPSQTHANIGGEESRARASSLGRAATTPLILSSIGRAPEHSPSESPGSASMLTHPRHYNNSNNEDALSPRSMSATETNVRPLVYCSLFVFLCFFVFVCEYIYVDRSVHLAEEEKFETATSLLKSRESELEASRKAFTDLRNNLTQKEEWIDDLLIQLNDRDRALSLYRELTQQLQEKEAATEAEQAARLQEAQLRAQAILNQTALMFAANGKAHAKVETVTRVDENGAESDFNSVNGTHSPVSVDTHLVDAEGNNYILSKPSDSSLKTVDTRLIVDLGIVIISSAIGGLIASFFNQPVLLGYLIAGSAIGPGGLGLIGQFVQVETLAELGTSFLLFALGVEFSFSQLRKVANIAVGGGLLMLMGCIITTAFVITFVLYLPLSKGLFIGAMLAMSSTTVVMKSLMERKEMNSSIGQIMLGLLIVQDLFLSLILSILALVEIPHAQLLQGVLFHGAKFALLACIVIGASYLWPVLLRMLDYSKSHDLFLLGLVAMCVMLTVTAEKIIGSAEVGAFLAGILISSSPTADPALIHRALRIFEPLKDFFGAVFFSAMGMLIHPHSLLDNWIHLLIFVSLTVTLKSLITFVVCRILSLSSLNALHIALCLSQIGEFSFILASQGLRASLIDRDDYMMLLGVTAVSIFVTPALISGSYYIRHRFVPVTPALTAQSSSSTNGHFRDSDGNRQHEVSIHTGHSHGSKHSDLEVNSHWEKSHRKEKLSDSADRERGWSIQRPRDDEVMDSQSERDDERVGGAVVKHTALHRTHSGNAIMHERSAFSPSQSAQSTPAGSALNVTGQPVANWRDRRRQRQLDRARRLAAAEDADADKADDEHGDERKSLLDQ